MKRWLKDNYDYKIIIRRLQDDNKIIIRWFWGESQIGWF